MRLSRLNPCADLPAEAFELFGGDFGVATSNGVELDEILFYRVWPVVYKSGQIDATPVGGRETTWIVIAIMDPCLVAI
ncbi:hypothetical protein GCM10027081_03650 [Cupriavidus yeoncheonensis]